MPLGLNLLRILGWAVGNYTPTRTFNPLTSTDQEFRNSYATLLEDLKASNLFGGPQVANAAPVNTVPPSISGTSSVGSVLTAVSGTWTGIPTPTLTGQWYRGSSAISGATGSTYTIVSGDVGSALKYRQTGTNSEGSAFADSNTITATTATTWILAGGTWNDAGVWDDNAIWNDGSVAYSLALNYAARLEAEGHEPLDSEEFALVLEVFQSAEDNGVTVNSGWLFGSRVNIDVTNNLNLIAGKPSMVPADELHEDSNTSAGMIALRIAEAGQGLTTEDGSPFFAEHGPYSVLCLGNSIGDRGSVYGEWVPIAYTQTPNNFFAISGANGVQLGDYPAPGHFLGGSSNGGSANTRDALVQPMMHWLCFDDEDNIEFYHPSNNGGTPAPFSGQSIEDYPLSLGNYVYEAPFNVGFLMMLRFDGQLDTEARRDIFDRVYAKWRKIGKSVAIIGTSNTISGVATIQWPREFQKWGMYNNCIVIRRAQGARRLTFFAPAGYELPGPPADIADPGYTASWPFDFLDWFAANVFINDEQANTVAGGQPWVNWLHCHNAFTAHLKTLNDPSDIRAIMCTQIAHWMNETAWPGFSAWPGFGNSNLYQVSNATRAATLSDFENVPTAIADVWAMSNLGWDVEDDGDPPDPINDYANGNPALMGDVFSHFNNDGQMLLFQLYRDAFLELMEV